MQKLTVRHLCNTPNEEAWSVELCKNPELVKKAILRELFNVNDIGAAEYSRLNLPRHPGNALSEKKLTSLSQKYHSIPAEKMHWYPAPPEPKESENSHNSSSEEEITLAEVRAKVQAKSKRARSKARAKAQGKLLDIRVPKRPKGSKKQEVLNVPVGQKSLLSFVKFTPKA